jgi:hypothetical protein
MIEKRNGLSIWKRDADCYDVSDGKERIGALRSEFTEDEKRNRTMIPGTWGIRWEGSIREDFKGWPDLRFGTAHEAFAFFCSQVLG